MALFRILGILIVILLLVPPVNARSKGVKVLDDEFVLEVYRFRRFPDPNPTYRDYWNYSYIGVAPRDFFLGEGTVTMPRGDSIIISLVPVQWIAAQLGTLGTKRQIIEDAGNWSRTYRYTVPKLEDDGVVLENESITVRGPPPIVSVLYYMDWFVNSLGSLPENLTNANMVLEIEWSVEGSGLLFPVTLSPALDGDLVPYAGTSTYFRDLFEKRYCLVPSSTGFTATNTTMDVMDPASSILQNTFILAPMGDGEIMVTVTVRELLSGESRSFTLRVPVGEPLWAPFQGHGITDFAWHEFMSMFPLAPDPDRWDWVIGGRDYMIAGRSEYEYHSNGPLEM